MQGLALAGEKALLGQRDRHLVVGHPAGQVADRLQHDCIGAQVPPEPGAVHPVCRPGTTTPEDQEVRPVPACPDRHGDGCHHEAEQALAVQGCRGVRPPQGREVQGKPAHLLCFHGIQRPQLGGELMRIVLLQPFRLGQCRFPAALQFADDQTIVGVHRVILSLRQACLVAGTLDTKLPLPIHSLALLLQVPQRGEGGFQPGRPHRLQDCRHDHGIDLTGDE